VSDHTVLHSLGACNFPHRISTPSTLQRTMPTPRGRGGRLELPKNIEYNKLHLQIPSEEKTMALTLSFKKPPSIDNTHQLDKAVIKSKSATFFYIYRNSNFQVLCLSPFSYTIASYTILALGRPPVNQILNHLMLSLSLMFECYACSKTTSELVASPQ